MELSGKVTDISSGVPGMKRLDENFFGKLRANAEADVANLADDVGLLGQETDFLFFAKAHLAKAMFYFGRRG
jgi:hypothetical protein